DGTNGSQEGNPSPGDPMVCRSPGCFWYGWSRGPFSCAKGRRTSFHWHFDPDGSEGMAIAPRERLLDKPCELGATVGDDLVGNRFGVHFVRFPRYGYELSPEPSR